MNVCLKVRNNEARVRMCSYILLQIGAVEREDKDPVPDENTVCTVQKCDYDASFVSCDFERKSVFLWEFIQPLHFV